jgi:hypothetical protein
MKHGKSNNTDSEFPWWILPDKPGRKLTSGFAGNPSILDTTDPDWNKVEEQEQGFREILGRSCKGKWMETHHRYFFELEEDYEMFLIMCTLSSS